MKAKKPIACPACKAGFPLRVQIPVELDGKPAFLVVSVETYEKLRKAVAAEGLGRRLWIHTGIKTKELR